VQNRPLEKSGRGLSELDGKGRSRFGGVGLWMPPPEKNALKTSRAGWKARIAALPAGLPRGVEIVPTLRSSEFDSQIVWATLRGDRLN